MNKLVRLSAFADEASSSVDEQIKALKRNGLHGVELRQVDGENISSISLAKAREIKKKLDDAGIVAWSLGSPIGKIDIESGDYAAELNKLKHTIDLAHELGSDNIRMFSFFIPSGKDAGCYRQKVLDRMGEMAQIAHGTGVTLCHENEKGIYGDISERCLEIHQAYPEIAGVFDPANYVQCNQDTWQGWELLRSYVKYMHIKDAKSDGVVVPAGQGVGQVKRIVDAFLQQGGQWLSIEPHLQHFTGLAALEREGERTQIGEYAYASSDAAFAAACTALKQLL